MDYYEDRLESASDILDNELKTKDFFHFKYLAKLDKEVELKASFYNSGLHINDTSKLRLNVHHGRFKLKERIYNLKQINTEVSYGTDKLLADSEITGKVHANIPNKEIQLYSLAFGYHKEERLHLETGFVRKYEEVEEEKDESEKTQQNDVIKKSWKTSIHQNLSGRLYSTPTYSIGFGVMGQLDLEVKEPVYSVPDAGLTYQRSGQSHVLRYQIEKIGTNLGLFQYICHKNISDQAALALRIGRDLTEKKNTVEFGLKYQPRKDVIYRAKIDNELYLTSGFSFQFSEFVRASVAIKHNFKAYPKSSAPNQAGVVRTPMLFRLTFGV